MTERLRDLQAERRDLISKVKALHDKEDKGGKLTEAETRELNAAFETAESLAKRIESRQKVQALELENAKQKSKENPEYEKEARKVSFLQACRYMQKKPQSKDDFGRLKEVGKEIENRGFKPQHGGIMVPIGRLEKRAVETDSAGAGASIPTDVRVQNYVEELYQISKVLPLLKSYSFAERPASIPKAGATQVTAGWHQEGEAIAESTPNFVSLSSKPRYLTALTKVSLESMKQAPTVEGIIRRQMARKSADVFDKDLLDGDNSSDTWKVDGVLRHSASFTSDTDKNNAVVTYDDVLSLIEDLQIANMSSLRFMTHPTLRKVLRQIEINSNERSPILDNAGMIEGLPLTVNNHVTAKAPTGGDILCADWNRLGAVVNYGAMEILSGLDGSDFSKALFSIRSWLPADSIFDDFKAMARLKEVKLATA